MHVDLTMTKVHVTADGADAGGSDADKLSKNTAREDWKRYRKKFQQPVKFRSVPYLVTNRTLVFFYFHHITEIYN